MPVVSDYEERDEEGEERIIWKWSTPPGSDPGEMIDDWWEVGIVKQGGVGVGGGGEAVMSNQSLCYLEYVDRQS